ncbi:MAG: hypothetical protein JO354_01510 [Verrucomicrobia bacterium]|nr:hypothetical protein [Verrucomicrobiota bacterium]
MKAAVEIVHVPPHYLVWNGYDAAVKAELWSSAIEIAGHIVAVDPTALSGEAKTKLTVAQRIGAVVVTNANHTRAAKQFARAAEIFVPAESSGTFPQAQILSDGFELFEITAIKIEGAAPGEFALHDAREGGSVIIGDALINFGAHGFDLLPAKYCTSQKRMIRSLRRLLELPFTRMFFAHGEPITARANERLRTLLENCA